MLRPRVKLLSRGEQCAKLGERMRVLGHRPLIALRDNTVPVVLGPRTQPDRVAARAEQAVVRGVVDDRATGREDHRRGRGEQPGQHLALDAPVVRLAVHREHLGERQAGGFLDLLIELHERDRELLRERLADRGLSRAAHAEQRDRLLGPVSIGRGEQHGGRGAQCVRDLGEAPERDVAVAGLELREEPLADPGVLRELAP